MVVYGQPRLTADLDVTVEASLERVLALIPALRERGFDPRSPEPAELLHRARLLPVVHKPSGLARHSLRSMTLFGRSVSTPASEGAEAR